MFSCTCLLTHSSILCQQDQISILNYCRLSSCLNFKEQSFRIRFRFVRILNSEVQHEIYFMLINSCQPSLIFYPHLPFQHPQNPNLPKFHYFCHYILANCHVFFFMDAPFRVSRDKTLVIV